MVGLASTGPVCAVVDSITPVLRSLRLVFAGTGAGTVPLLASASVDVLGTFSDGSERNVTATADLRSSNPAVATVSNSGASKGVISALALGTTTISAALDGVQVSAPLTVVEADLISLIVVPQSTLSLAVGATAQVTVTGAYADGNMRDLTEVATYVNFDLFAQNVLTVSNTPGSKGLITALAPGVTTVRIGVVTASGVEAQALIQVTVAP